MLGRLGYETPSQTLYEVLTISFLSIPLPKPSTFLWLLYAGFGDCASKAEHTQHYLHGKIGLRPTWKVISFLINGNHLCLPREAPSQSLGTNV